MMIMYNQLIIGISSHNYFGSQLFLERAQIQHLEGDGNDDDHDTISLSYALVIIIIIILVVADDDDEDDYVVRHQ